MWPIDNGIAEESGKKRQTIYAASLNHLGRI